MPKVKETPRGKGGLPLPSATMVSAVGYMLENPVHPSGTRSFLSVPRGIDRA